MNDEVNDGQQRNLENRWSVAGRASGTGFFPGDVSDDLQGVAVMIGVDPPRRGRAWGVNHIDIVIMFSDYIRATAG